MADCFGVRSIIPWRMRDQLEADERNLKALLDRTVPFQEREYWDKLEETLSWTKSDIRALRRMARENSMQVFYCEATDSLIMKAENPLRRRIQCLINNGYN